jgi:CHAD domain-containing protein
MMAIGDERLTRVPAQGEKAPPVPGPPPAAAASDLRLLLDLAEADLARFKQSPTLAAAQLRRPVTRRLAQVYWDTSELSLGRAGLALAVETAGQRRSQLLRRVNPAAGNLRAPAQQVAPLAGDGLDPSRLALLPGADPALIAGLAREMLVPVFAIDLTRMIWTVQDGDLTVSVTLETGWIEAGAGKIAFRQVALAPVAGPPAPLFDIALRLHDEVALRLAARDPAQLGYGLIAGTDWWAGAASAERLEPGMTLRAAILAIGRVAGTELRAAMARLERDCAPEPIHQARVAIRRLRSLLSVFRDVLPATPCRSLGQELGALGGILAEAREFDVLLADTVEPLIRASGEAACLAPLRAAALARRTRAAVTIAATAAGHDFARLSCRLAEFFDAGLWPAPESEPATALDQPCLAYAKAALRKRHRALEKAGAMAGSLAPDQLHKLRISAKKLRYAAEFLEALFAARRVKRYVAALKGIQDHLGTLNDAVIARALLEQLAPPASGAPADERADGKAEGLVAGWAAAQVARSRAEFAQALKIFTKTRRFWT